MCHLLWLKKFPSKLPNLYSINQIFAFQEIVGPIKTSLQQAYNHTLGLSHNINNSLGMLESLQKHSNRGQNRLSDEIAAGNFKTLLNYLDVSRFNILPLTRLSRLVSKISRCQFCETNSTSFRPSKSYGI